MDNSDFRNSSSEIRRLRTEIDGPARRDRPPHEVHLDTLPEVRGVASERNQESILLDAVAGHVMLTTMEDSLETMLDVLREMRSLAVARCHCEGPAEAIAQNAASHYISSRPRGGTDSDRPTIFNPCRCERLRGLRQELCDLMENARFEGIPLLDSTSPPPPVFIDLAPNTALRVELEAPSSAILSVKSTQVDAPGAHVLTRAIADVNESLVRLAGLRGRLRMMIEDQSLSARRHGGDHGDLPDACSVRAHLATVGRRIAEDAVEAFLAQANAERRLIDFLYRHCAANTLTRIHTIAGDHDNGAGTRRSGGLK